MEQPYYEKIFETSPLGIKLTFCTIPGGYHPPHWHEEIEILYPLNGQTDITVENKKYKLPKKNAMVIESCKIHSSYTDDKSTAMHLRIHISKECLRSYFPDIILYQVHCIPSEITTEQFPEYYTICELFAKLTRLYMFDSPSFRLEAEGIILQAVARLFHFFSVKDTTCSDPVIVNQTSMERIRSTIRYVEQHFQENISLQDAAAYLGISREYFCRIFKKNMGISFLQYLNEVRLSKVYNDLQSTSFPISTIMERNGFTNQKLFNQSFKKMYGCTPSSVRNLILKKSKT